MSDSTAEPGDGAVPPTGKHRTAVLVGAVLVVGLLVGAALAGAFRPHRFTGTVVRSEMPAPDFTLESAAGPVSPGDFAGDVIVLFFGYTHCPDVCPTTLAELAATMDLLGSLADDVHVVFVSVDPNRDTPASLADFVTRFDERFVGVTGDPDTVADVAALYGIYYLAHGTEGSYLVDHTATVSVLDREGYLSLVFPFGTPAEAMAADIAAVAG